MPTFKKLTPEQVTLGRGRIAMERREPYRRALAASDAGRIELEPDERPTQVKSDIRRAAQDLGIRVRSSWETPERRVLLWKKTGAPR